MSNTTNQLIVLDGINQLLRSKILAAAVPAKTATYVPIPHALVIHRLEEFCYKSNVKIIKEQYKTNQNCRQVLGIYTLELGDEALKYQIAFKNSYDRTMALGFAAGATVFICSNGVVSGEVAYRHKHQGNILDELQENMGLAYNSAEQSFDKLRRELNLMKSEPVSRDLRNRLVGEMYLEEEILNTEQLQIFKKESQQSEHFTGNSAYDMYNWVTEALKKSHPSNYLRKHIALHNLFVSEFL